MTHSGKGFELIVGIPDETHDDVIGAGFGEAIEKLRRTVRWTTIRGLPATHHFGRLPVVSFEKRVDPLPGAAGILVNRQSHINRGDELASIAPRFAQDLLHLGPLLLPATEVGLVGEPAVEMPGRPLEGGADGAGHPDRRAAGAVWG